MNNPIIIILCIVIIIFIIYELVKNTNESMESITKPIKHNINPDVQEFLNQLASNPGPPLYTLSPVDARKVLDKLQTPIIKTPDVTIQDVSLPVGPSENVNVRIMRPVGNNNPLPIVLYFHGGGWVLGNKNTHEHLIRQLTDGAQVAIVFVEYTSSPDAQYPIPIQEAYASTKYIIDNAKRFNLDSSRIAVVGDSVGGNMATVIAMLYNNNTINVPKINLQLLFYPVTNANFETNSYNEFSDGPWLTKKAMQWFWDNYLPNKQYRSQPTASPLLADINLLKMMPKTLIITDENDVLRDEGEEYAKRLKDAGVNVTHTRYNGTIHDFMMLNGLSQTKQTKNAIKQAINFIKTEFKT